MPDLRLVVLGPDGGQTSLPCPWNPAPAFVTLAECRAEVPVLADGAFAPPPPAPMRIEDVLAALPAFPERSVEEAEKAGDREDWGVDETRPAPADSREYTLRRLMRLIVGLCDRQPKVPSQEFERWRNACEEWLLALGELEAELIATVKANGVDPFDSLLQPAFLPAEASPDAIDAHERMIDRVRKAWGLQGLPSLFGVHP